MPDQPKVLTPKTLGNLPIRQTDEPEWLSVILYGQPGVGKTVLAGSAAEVEGMSPVLILDAEQGTMSLTGLHTVDTIRITSYQDYQTVHNAIAKKEVDYKTLVIDSITEMSMMGLEEIVARSVAAGPSKTGVIHDPEQPDQGDWYRNNLRVHRIIRFFKKLKCHVIFTALERLDTDKTIPQLGPALNNRRLSAELPGAVDEIWYMYKKERRIGKEITHERFLLTDGTSIAMAKDRSRRLPKVIAEPTMQEIYNYYKGFKTDGN